MRTDGAFAMHVTRVQHGQCWCLLGQLYGIWHQRAERAIYMEQGTTHAWGAFCKLSSQMNSMCTTANLPGCEMRR